MVCVIAIGRGNAVASILMARPVSAQVTSPVTTTAIPADQLDSLVAPIALYPDPLLAQTLAASTYPLEIMQLQQFLQKNPKLTGQALANAVAPRLARPEGGEPSLRPLTSAIRYVIIVQAALVAPLLVWARPIVDLLLGSSYGKSAEVLQILTPYVFLMGISPLVSLAANYLGIATLRIPIVLSTVAVNVVIDIALIPRIGIIGGAIGTDIAYTFYVVGHLWICKTALGLSLRPIAIVLLRATIAAGAMAGVLFAIGTTGITPAEWVLGAVGGSLAYAAALIATREVSGAELRLVWNFAGRQLPRRAGA